jgi:hypothetical protein
MTADYRSTRGIESATAAYCLSALQALADGEQPESSETAAEYAQRHLVNLQKHHYIEPVRPLVPAPTPVVDMQAACSERMRQLEPNGYPDKAVVA